MLENWIPEKITISRLLRNKENPRTITKARMKKLIESLKGLGIFKPIICKYDYTIIGGTQRNIAILGLMDPSFEVYIMRPPRELSEEEYKQVLLLDNAHSGDWDYDVLANSFDIEMIKELDTDISLPELGEKPEGTEDDNPYTRKIEAPVYEPRGERPGITDLFDDDKYKVIVKNIESSALNEELKKFLTIAAARHIKFHYGMIAEYYCHVSADVQVLMEESALVVIDFEKAIELGFVRMTKDLAEVWGEENQNAS